TGRRAQRRPGCVLHAVVDRSFAALGRHPDDVLRRVLDVAGLAMDAVLGVDLQAVLAGFRLDELVDPGRAEAHFGAAEFRQVDGDTDGVVLQRQVDGLVLVVVGVGDVYRAETGEGR